MRGYRIPAAFILACALSACGSAPPLYSSFNPATQAYWTNPYWQADLFVVVQSVVHLPTNATGSDTSGIHATVKFLFANGKIENPEIVASTGDPELDKLMLQQVVTAKIPKPIGLHTDQPHEFELPLEMFTPYESFEYNVYAEIDRKKLYPRDAIIHEHTGNTTVDFDYLDAKASNIVIAKSSGHVELDKTSIDTVSSAHMPPPPPGYAGKTLHMVVIVCYDVNNTTKCPTGNNVIVVEGTRIKRAEIPVMMP